MLFIRFDIERADYEKSLEALLPVFAGKCKETGGSNFFEKIVVKLDDKAVPVSLKLLRSFDEETKNAVLVNLAADHCERLTDTLNDYLETVLPGNVIRIGKLACGLEGGKPVLWASGVEIDYPALLKSELVQKNAGRMAEEAADRFGDGNTFLGRTMRAGLRVLGMGAKVAPDEVEELGVLILRSETVKAKLMPVLLEALQRRGVAVESMSMAVETARQPGERRCETSWESLQEPILDSLAAWLISTVD